MTCYYKIRLKKMMKKKVETERSFNCAEHITVVELFYLKTHNIYWSLLNI